LKLCEIYVVLLGLNGIVGMSQYIRKSLQDKLNIHISITYIFVNGEFKND